MVTQELNPNNLEKPYEDPNLMPMDFSESEAVIQVEGSGVVPVSETTNIPGSLLAEVRGQRLSLPSSEEGKQHAEQQTELPKAARDAAFTALQHTVEAPPYAP